MSYSQREIDNLVRREKKMKDRATGEYKCPQCGSWHDRLGKCDYCRRQDSYSVDKALLDD